MAESAIIIIAPWMEIKRYKEMYVYYTVYIYTHIYIYISRINSASGFSHFAVFFFFTTLSRGHLSGDLQFFSMEYPAFAALPVPCALGKRFGFRWDTPLVNKHSWQEVFLFSFQVYIYISRNNIISYIYIYIIHISLHLYTHTQKMHPSLLQPCYDVKVLRTLRLLRLLRLFRVFKGVEEAQGSGYGFDGRSTLEEFHMVDD